MCALWGVAGCVSATSPRQIASHVAWSRSVGDLAKSSSCSTSVARIDSSQPSHAFPVPKPAQDGAMTG